MQALTVKTNRKHQIPRDSLLTYAVTDSAYIYSVYVMLVESTYEQVLRVECSKTGC